MEVLDLKELTKLLAAPKVEPINRRNIFFRRLSAGIILFLVDTTVLSLTMFLSLFLRDIIWAGEVDLRYYVNIVPVIIFLFPIAFYFRGLYPAFGVDVIDELKNLTYSITIVYAIVAAMSFLLKGSWEYSRIAFLLSWLLSLALVPIGRSATRKICSSKSWWGIPVFVIGAGEAGEKVIKSLMKHKQIGLRPLVAVDDDINRWGYIEGIPVVGGLETIPELAHRLKVDHSIIAMPKVPRIRQKEIIEKYSKYFAQTTVIPDLFGLTSLWVSTRDLGGILGLEVQQRLIRKSSRIKKRIFDLVLSITLGLFAFPICLFISAMIWLDSKGKVFFRQERMGLGDSRFDIVKFRTMHIDAEDRLTHLLKNDNDLKCEYEVYHKLRNDPRMTRVGKFLRKFSLDELPQFINVIKGEMSLIGPRAYMPWEKYKMNGHEEMILNVKPGISGLWQVTDRNASSFEERNIIDVYYIRNWSMFLDLYILARTIAVVFSGKGAY
ncbi:MAG: undecaprenyl-phosphate galactose phosphotransferase WbaP [Bacteroidetes bacterium]|nr:MAG: undecaprenyl-phosphate galactose phosphotransferase WbaP [Bacteroidota bacterium]